jgi:arsenate reductase
MPLPDDETLLLHNPRCSKSRGAKSILEERRVEFRERRYLEEPLSREELEDLATRLGLAPSEWVRRKEAAFAEAGLEPSSDDGAILDAVAAHPVLMERPVLIRGRRAVIGRPPEKILDLL